MCPLSILLVPIALFFAIFGGTVFNDESMRPASPKPDKRKKMNYYKRTDAETDARESRESSLITARLMSHLERTSRDTGT